MKALVTGCAGFIGSHLTERLLGDGFDVIGIDYFTDYYPREYKDKNIKNALEDDAFTLVEQDILSMDAFPDVDYVFHQAAQAGVRKSWGGDFEIIHAGQYPGDPTVAGILQGQRDKKNLSMPHHHRSTGTVNCR